MAYDADIFDLGRAVVKVLDSRVVLDTKSVEEAFAETILATRPDKTLAICDVGLSTGCASQSRKENVPPAAVQHW